MGGIKIFQKAGKKHTAGCMNRKVFKIAGGECVCTSIHIHTCMCIRYLEIDVMGVFRRLTTFEFPSEARPFQAADPLPCSRPRFSRSLVPLPLPCTPRLPHQFAAPPLARAPPAYAQVQGKPGLIIQASQSSVFAA